jgi:hypothetical protein
MIVFTRNGNLVVPVFVPGIQSFVDTEDVLKAMSQHIKPSGLIDNMFIEFENTSIPLYSQDECRIVAHMAAAYHNACLAKTLSSEKDLYGNAYTQHNNLDSEDKLFWINQNEPEKIKTQNSRNKGNRMQRSTKKEMNSDKEWDEELHGERLVYDATYEINGNLVPWLMQPDEWEEKYGMY